MSQGFLDTDSHAPCNTEIMECEDQCENAENFINILYLMAKIIPL